MPAKCCTKWQALLSLKMFAGIFDYCLKAFDKMYEEWDWHLHMLELASNWHERSRRSRVIQTLGKPFQDEYKRETIERITYEVKNSR